MTLLEFARQFASRHETCAGFTMRWLQHIGFRGRVPTTSEIHYRWREDGVLHGAEKQFALMGLERCEPGPHCIVVVEQDGGGPLVGITGNDGHFVTRSFGTVKFTKEPRIIAAWHIPGATHV